MSTVCLCPIRTPVLKTKVHNPNWREWWFFRHSGRSNITCHYATNHRHHTAAAAAATTTTTTTTTSVLGNFIFLSGLKLSVRASARALGSRAVRECCWLWGQFIVCSFYCFLSTYVIVYYCFVALSGKIKKKLMIIITVIVATAAFFLTGQFLCSCSFGQCRKLHVGHLSLMIDDVSCNIFAIHWCLFSLNVFSVQQTFASWNNNALV